MEERLKTHTVFRGTTPAQFQTALDGVEKFVMTKIYKMLVLPKPGWMFVRRRGKFEERCSYPLPPLTEVS